MRIFVDAANATGAGGRALARALVPRLGNAAQEHTFVVALPDTSDYRALRLSANVQPEYWARGAPRLNGARRLYHLYHALPAAIRRARADACLTLADLGPHDHSCPHVVFLQQALLLYASELGGLDSWSGPKRRYLEWHFRRCGRDASAVIVQTPVMAERVANRFGVPRERVRVVTLPAPTAASGDTGIAPATLPTSRKPARLLFLAAAYRHKNHAILPAVLAELRRRGLDRSVEIWTTLTEAEFSAVRARNDEAIVNLGRLTADEVRGAYRAATALFLPTLVESYGFPYVEALGYGLPVLTSDRDFARFMCRDLAVYFDPLSAASIVDAIERHLLEGRQSALPERARERLRDLCDDWDTVARQFVDAVAGSVERDRDSTLSA